jgi:hypothetical protein
MEGTNNKIKTLKRQAYGYRDQEFFKLRILIRLQKVLNPKTRNQYIDFKLLI